MKTTIFLACLTLMLLLAKPTLAGLFDQETKITASDAAPDDFFGVSVAIDGNTAIVGAYRDNDGGSNSGSAYLFDATTGDELFKLIASDSEAFDFFGLPVGISGNIAIVGSQSDDTEAGISSGSAYLFDTTTGQELFKLTASDGVERDLFGASVSISGDVAIVGAWRNGDAGIDSGSAYFFDVRTGEQLHKLTASDAAPNDFFGIDVAISDNVAIVGAGSDDDDGSKSGSVYVFDVTTGEELLKLTASDAKSDDAFGSSLAIDGRLALIGSGSDDHGPSSGSAYLFDVTTGTELFKLTASDASRGDLFGTSVAISGSMAVVGAFNDNDYSGSAYVFDTATGQELRKLTSSDAAFPYAFGGSVAISDFNVVVGAQADDSSGPASGSAYLFNSNVIPEPSSKFLAVISGLLFMTSRTCSKRRASLSVAPQF